MEEIPKILEEVHLEMDQVVLVETILPTLALVVDQVERMVMLVEDR